VEIGFEVERARRRDLGYWVVAGLFVFWVWHQLSLPCFFPEQGRLIRCQRNLRALAQQLESYRAAHANSYPHRLEELRVGLPACAANPNGYFYRRSPDGQRFRLVCNGDGHAEAFRGFSGSFRNLPAYDSRDGMMSHP